MTALATVRPERAVEYVSALRSVERLIAAANTLDEVTDVRARIEAAKAWAKVHGKVRELRLLLLRAEVAALVRVYELGGAGSLSAADRRAAEHLAAMSVEEREALLSQSGNKTTAAGLCAVLWAEEERAAERRRGRSWAEGEPVGEGAEVDSESARASARRNAVLVSGALARVVEDYAGETEFTVDELASEIIEDSARGFTSADDPSFVEGVREVVRRALRQSTPGEFAGTVVPRFITCRTPSGGWLRKPTPAATVADLADMVTLRQEQLEQDRAALARLEAFAERVNEHPGVTAETRLATILLASRRPT